MPEVGVGGLNKEHYLLVPWGGGQIYFSTLWHTTKSLILKSNASQRINGPNFH